MDINIKTIDWNRRMSDIMNNFQQALVSLIPVMENSGIPWQDEEQTEDFEGISEALYQWFVLYKIETLAETNNNPIPNLPKYCHIYNDYSKLSYILITKKVVDYPGSLAFNFLKSKESPFDTVVCNIVDGNNKVISQDYEVPSEDAIFKFQLNKFLS